MKRNTIFIISALFGICSMAIPPQVSNLRVSQKSGTKLVEISYELSDIDSDLFDVTISVYTNNGNNYYYEIPAFTFSGDWSFGVLPGTKNTAFWDAGEDWNDSVSTQVWIRVNAFDLTTRKIPTNDMVLIPEGWFNMGDSYDESYYDDAIPVHSVYVSDFWLSRYEFTFQQLCELLQWAYDQGRVQVGGSSGHIVYITEAETNNIDNDHYLTTSLNSSSWLSFSSGRFIVPDSLRNFPATWITWYGAMALCNYKSQRDGLQECISFFDWSCDFSKNGYRLPTEAEWEKAARGGLDGHHFPWPSYGGTWREHIDQSKASYCERKAVGFYDGLQTPYGVDMANGYGLYDMSGNAWEWCYDWYRWTYYNFSPSMDPTGPPTGDAYIWVGPCRVIRSIWPANFYDADYDALGCAARYAFEPFSGRSEVSFRMARTHCDLSLQYANIRSEASSIHGPITIDTTGTNTPGILQFQSSTTTADANAGSVTLSVMRMGGTLGTASVDYATSNDTALAGTDYSATNGTLTWVDGDSTQQTVSVTLLPSTGGDKTFSVTLGNTTGATPGEGYTNAVVTIKSAESRNPVYRLYSYGQPDSTYEHVWTTDWNEMAIMSTAYGWLYEGVAWRAFTEYVQGTVPLYRLYAPSTRMHHYTIDGNEYYILTQHSGGAWNGEGIQYFVYPDDSVPGTMPVYRFYHAGMGLHHFTIDAGEAAVIQATPEWGYVYEDIGFYVYPAE